MAVMIADQVATLVSTSSARFSKASQRNKSYSFSLPTCSIPAAPAPFSSKQLRAVVSGLRLEGMAASGEMVLDCSETWAARLPLCPSSRSAPPASACTGQRRSRPAALRLGMNVAMMVSSNGAPRQQLSGQAATGLLQRLTRMGFFLVCSKQQGDGNDKSAQARARQQRVRAGPNLLDELPRLRFGSRTRQGEAAR